VDQVVRVWLADRSESSGYWMSRQVFLQALITAFSCLLFFTMRPPTVFAGPVRTGCTSDVSLINGCAGNGQVVLKATQADGERARDRPGLTDPGGNVSAGKANVVTVGCGGGTQSQLSGLGLGWAGIVGAAICGPWNQLACTLQSKADGEARAVGTQVQVDPGGQGHLAGEGCDVKGPRAGVVGPPAVSGSDVTAYVRREISASGIGVAPPGGRTLVNIQTLLWVNSPAGRTLSATLLGQAVTIQLRAARVDWDYGDGTIETRADAGHPYDPRSHPCDTKLCPYYDGHVYRQSGTATLTATVAWQVSFTTARTGTITIPGTTAAPPSHVALRILQARAELVPPR
jgi:hypothetical protein